MINSQVPYNHLPALNGYRIREDAALVLASDLCKRSLYHLSGFLDAIQEDERLPMLEMLKLSEARFSFDLEGRSLSQNRLFEAWSSENRLGDEKAAMILDYTEWFSETETEGLAAMAPVYASRLRRKGELFRERKEERIYSPFTGLCLYTAPQQRQKLSDLKTDLDMAIREGLPYDPLISMCLIHFQFRALAPFAAMNAHCGRAYMQMALRKLGLFYDVLPLSKQLSERSETYNALIRDVLGSGKMNDWCLFMLDVIQRAAESMLKTCRRMLSLRRKVHEQLEKYTEYPLPPAGLLKVLFYRPYIKPAYLIRQLSCHRHSAYIYLGHLQQMGLLTVKSSGREKLYLHRELLDVLSNP